MQSSNLFIFTIGFIAQLLFSARILHQWIISEKARKILSPPAFWILSILGSYLLFLYGVLRNDFAIIIGQFFSYYIYLWNLNMQGIWQKVGKLLKIIIIITPIVATIILLRDISNFTDTFIFNKNIPMWLLVFGSAGQTIFSLRFIYQFLYSTIHHESILPIGFWIISLLGSSIIIIYALYRLDPVLLIGQSFGFIAYVRNIMIGYRDKSKLYEE